MQIRLLTLWTRTQFSPTKSLLSIYLTCHSSAIYTYKVTCLPCMLFNCLILLPNANYALNYTCWQALFQNVAPPKLYSTLHAEIRYLLSGFATIVFWQIWALEAIVHNLKSIANFGNPNVFFLYQWNLLGGRYLVKCVLGWIGGVGEIPQ